MSKAPAGSHWRPQSAYLASIRTSQLLQRPVFLINCARLQRDSLLVSLFARLNSISVPKARICQLVDRLPALLLRWPSLLDLLVLHSSPAQKGLPSSRHRQDMSAVPLLSTTVNATKQSAANVTNTTCTGVYTPIELFVVLSLLSLLENILVVIAILKNRNLHSPMYFFICCLAVSDMLVSVSHLVETSVILMIQHGVVDIPQNALRQMDNIFDMMICSSVVSSLSFLGVIAVDRYITIFYALRYHSIMTIRRAMIIIILIWVLSTISSTIFIAYHSSNVVIICLISFFLFMLTLMVTLYIHMFVLARQHARSISNLNKRRSTPHRTSLKGAVTLTILLGIFFLCWGPFFLHLTLIVSCPKNPICTCVFSYFNLFLILIICNSVIDPIIYAFRSEELRKTLKEIAFCSW